MRGLLRASLLTVASSLIGCGTVTPLIISPNAAVLVPGQTIQFTASTSNGLGVANAIWRVNGNRGGSSTEGTITSSGLYTAPDSSSAAKTIEITVNDASGGGNSPPAFVTLFAANNFVHGAVASTNNPLVALYSFTAPSGSSVQVQFGADTNYGLATSSQQAPPAGGVVEILVAGMHASSAYHMQAVVQLPGGGSVVDTDHVFTTGSIPADVIPNITAQQVGSTAPAPGIELLALDPNQGGSQLTAVATDLAGNIVWYYQLEPGEWPYPIKPLPNGHMLVVAAPPTNNQGQISPSSTHANEVREIDLAGNVINRITLTQIDDGLKAMGSTIQIESLHHDILPLANGHFVLLANYPQTVNSQVMLGDVLIDWDPKNGPVWIWSAFDHLDPTHAPYGIGDWTHANAVIYSPDDGNLILSMRNQNWVAKIDYEDGRGDGSVLWRLGPGGDFSLPSGYTAGEWNYGQHYPTLAGPRSMGDFTLMFFNNGNERPLGPNGEVCDSVEGPFTPGVPQCYSSVPVFELNEVSKAIEAIPSEYDLSAFSACCGDAQVLSNQDLEFDVAFDLTQIGTSYIQEVAPGPSPQLVWQMNIKGLLAYRGFRIPSLYPGVEWSIPTTNAKQSAGKLK